MTEMRRGDDPKNINFRFPTDEVCKIIENDLENPEVFQGQFGKIGCGTDNGESHKPYNQDSAVVDTIENSFGVMDGIGGRPNSAEAARILAEELSKAFGNGYGTQEIALEVQRAASARIMNELGDGGVCYLAAKFLPDGGVNIFQAGDVKMIVVSDSGMVKFETRDERSDVGVTNYINQSVVGNATFTRCRVSPGDRVIIASDGLWDNIQPSLVAFYIKKLKAGEATKVLADVAKAKMRSDRPHTKRDNITILVMDIDHINNDMELPDITLAISGCESFYELSDFLKRIPGLQGSAKYYSSAELVQQVTDAQQRKLSLRKITNAGGLRSKVEKLLDDSDLTPLT